MAKRQGKKPPKQQQARETKFAENKRVMTAVLNEELSVDQAASILQRGARQIRRYLAKMKSKGTEGLAHGLLGKPSNRKIDDDTRLESIKFFLLTTIYLARDQRLSQNYWRRIKSPRSAVSR